MGSLVYDSSICFGRMGGFSLSDTEPLKSRRLHECIMPLVVMMHECMNAVDTLSRAAFMHHNDHVQAHQSNAALKGQNSSIYLQPVVTAFVYV